MKTLHPFPDYPVIKADGEHSYALAYLEAAIRSLHDNLNGLPSHEGLCEDLRDIPVRLAKAIERRRLGNV